MQILTAQIAAFEAVLLAASAGHKLIKWTDSVKVVRRFAGVQPWLAPPALAAALLAESGACLLMVVSAPAARAAGAMLAAVLWTAYLWFIARAVRQGRRDVDCGCSFGSGQHPLGRYHILRNVVLLCGAIAVAAGGAGGAAAPLQASQLLAACALLALYGALDLTMARQPLRSGETS